ncbi:MAG: thiamine pyrophosphate-dependent enzyme [Methanotrichaceae archaeon]
MIASLSLLPYYASLGFAVPASIGAQLARPDLRPVVLAGDGSFQMNGDGAGSRSKIRLEPNCHRSE